MHRTGHRARAWQQRPVGNQLDGRAASVPPVLPGDILDRSSYGRRARRFSSRPRTNPVPWFYRTACLNSPSLGQIPKVLAAGRNRPSKGPDRTRSLPRGRLCSVSKQEGRPSRNVPHPLLTGISPDGHSAAFRGAVTAVAFSGLLEFDQDTGEALRCDLVEIGSVPASRGVGSGSPGPRSRRLGGGTVTPSRRRSRVW